MTVVGLIYDQMTDDVKAQIVRDLLILNGRWDVAARDVTGNFDMSVLAGIGVAVETEKLPELYVVYKTGKEWPKSPTGIPAVNRDMCPDTTTDTLDFNEKVGYYLKPQGRDGANLTEMYLNRAYPKGNGVVDPLVVLLWS